MPDYKALENGIVERLQDEIDSVPVECAPNVPLTIDDLLSRVQGDQILVGYTGSRLSDFQTFDDPSDQEEVATFSVDVFTRDLRSHQGAYAVVTAVREALNGYELVTDCFLTLRGIRFSGLNESVWMFTLIFEITLQEN